MTAYLASTDHVTRGLRKLLGQFQDKPKLRALLATYLKQIQALEDHANATMATLTIGTGVGITLDRIGRIVGRGRNGLSDADYVFALRAQIRINRSSGTLQDFIDVLTVALHASQLFTVVAVDTGPGSVEVTVLGQLALTQVLPMWQNVSAARAGGIRLEFIFSVQTVANTFCCAPTMVGPTQFGPSSATQGFGWDSGAATGGHLAGEFSI